jgi:hypothetical protein
MAKIESLATKEDLANLRADLLQTMWALETRLMWRLDSVDAGLSRLLVQA